MLIFPVVLPTVVVAECTCDEEDESHDRGKAMRYKIAALASILIAIAIGVCIVTFHIFYIIGTLLYRNYIINLNIKINIFIIYLKI